MKSKKYLNARKTKSGYLQVHLRKHNVNSYYYIHRLVAFAFVDNPNSYKEINHLDENKENNYYMNLQWCTHLENTRYGTRNQRVSIKKINNEKVSFKVEQFNRDGKFVKAYPSLAEAARQNNFLVGEISRATRGIYKTYKGYIWRVKK